MDCFVARAPRNDVEDPLRLAGIRGPHSLPVIASASEAIHAATERKRGLLRRCAPRNDVEGPLRIAGMRRTTLPPRHCERSEAIHAAAKRKNGLLPRCAPRNHGVRLSDGTERSR